jgi:hypothetical protein
MICPLQLRAKTRAIALVALVLGPPLLTCKHFMLVWALLVES